MFTFPVNLLAASRRGQLAYVSRQWLQELANGARKYPNGKYAPLADKIERQLQREPDRDVFDIAYASHRQRRDAEYLQSTGR